jgi:hypothetical protein
MPESGLIQGSRGKYPYNEWKYLVTVIHLYSYADESGLEGNPPYCLLAGYIASPNQWNLFNHEWKEVLREFGVSSFHAKDFFPFKARKHHKEYENWSEKKAKLFIYGITEAIKNHGIHSLGCAVDVSAFNTFTIGERRFLTGGIWDSARGTFTHLGKPSAPYFAAFQYFVREALNRTPSNAKLHLIFHYQSAMEPKAHEIVAEMIAMPQLMPGSEKLVGIEYHYSIEEPQLQAADLYTYGWYDFCRHGVSTNSIMRLAMTQLTSKEKGMGIFNLEGIEANLQKHLSPCERARIQEQR